MDPVKGSAQATHKMPGPEKKETKTSQAAKKVLKPKTRPLLPGQMVFKKINGKWTLVKTKSHKTSKVIGSWTKEEKAAIERSRAIV